MARTKLDRRTFLRGAGGVAIALPWMEIMGEPLANAAPGDGLAKRFLGVYTPGGTVRDRWVPSGTENEWQLSTILEPLQAVKDKLLVFDGLSMHSARGEQHQSGIIAWLTGNAQSQNGGKYALSPSIDQALAERISNPHLAL